jgi:hypothetical protein
MMAYSTSTAAPFAQGQDVSRLRAVVDRSTKEVKEYAEQYEDQRVIVEALDIVAQADPANKQKLDILELRERRLEVARDRENAAMTNLTNYLITDSSAVHAKQQLRKDSAGTCHRAHSDAMSYHKTPTAILWHIVEIVHQQSNPSGTTAPSPYV